MQNNLNKPVVFVNANLISLLKESKVSHFYAEEVKGEQVFHLTEEKSSSSIPVLKKGLDKEFDSSIRLEEDEEGELKFFYQEGNRKLECELILGPSENDLYARTKGLLETGLLRQKNVAIIGLGSFGSNVAVELAKCGLKNFSLFDFDRLEPGNIVRHVCGFRDIGRLKTFAVKGEILQKNPSAQIQCFNFDINEEKDEFRRALLDTDLVFCLTDENKSRLLTTEVAIELNTTVLFGRAITRAEGGDVLRFRPSEGPCIACLTGKGIFKPKEEELSTVKQSARNAPAYMDPHDIEARVQVGLTSDIMPICNLLVKLSLFELTKGAESGIESLEEDFEADYYFWVNRRENKYKNFRPLKYQSNAPSILRWYGVRLNKNPHCLICGL